MILRGLPPAHEIHDAIVVGAGPAGIVQALELRRHGVSVTLIAGGADGFDAQFQDMAEAEIADPRRHAPLGMAVRRALGGTSLLWGGRCVPFDECDFAPRPRAAVTGWPLTHAEISGWYGRALAYLDGGAPLFTAPLDLPETECRFDRLERWSDGRNLRHIHARALESDPGLRVWLGAVATGLDIDPIDGHVRGVELAALGDGRRFVQARAVVLACGGLETTRLLLAARMHRPGLFGGPEGPLGCYYMGHLEGRIAEIVFDRPGADHAFDFFIDTTGRYVRRRIVLADAVQARLGLLNLAAWPDNPALGDPRHRSAILSLACLALATPGLGAWLAPEGIRRKHLEGGFAPLAHLGNVLRGLPEAAREATQYLRRRYCAQPHLPGFFIPNRGRRYALFYHAEQAPNRDSTVRLSERRDALGMPRLAIDLRYQEIDARSVVESHRVIERSVRDARLGHLVYTVPEPERVAAVLDQATDGYHQIGTARMADSPRDGVVDRDCRVHGTPNLFLAGSAVFPTSGQANPTLLLAALSARLAQHIAASLTELPDAAPVQQPEPALAAGG